MLFAFLVAIAVFAVALVQPRTPGDAWFSRREWRGVIAREVPVHDAPMGAYRAAGDVELRYDEAPRAVRSAARLGAVTAFFYLPWALAGGMLAWSWLEHASETALAIAIPIQLLWPFVPMLMLERASDALLHRRPNAAARARRAEWAAAASLAVAAVVTLVSHDWQSIVCFDAATLMLVFAARRVRRTAEQHPRALAPARR